MTANEIAAQEAKNANPDPYHANLLRAATLLIVAGRGSAEYRTQWVSGTTAWQDGTWAVNVQTDGTILTW